jgi:hypothetical protein
VTATNEGAAPRKIFAWRAVILAPLLVPLLASAAMATSLAARNPLLAFLLFLVGGCVVSYGGTVVLLLPCLYVLRRLTSPTLARTGLVGVALGAVVFLPLAWVSWISSGVDSGPPSDTFVENLARQLDDPFCWFFPLAGGVTATAYWLLLPRRRRADPAGR